MKGKAKSIKTYFIGGMLMVIAIVMSLQAAIGLYSFKNSMETKVQESLANQAGQIIGNLDNRFNTIGRSTELLAYDIEAMPKYDSDLLLAIVEKYINSDSLIIGSGFWFEPFAFQPDLKYYGPYKYKDDKGKVVLTWDYSNAEYDYPKYDWYKNGLTAKNKVVWSPPYEDAVTTMAMITSSSPIKKDGKVIGVTTTDIGLNELSEYVRNIKVGDSGYAFMVSAEGTYLGHKEKEKDLKEKITDDEDAKVKQLGNDIIKATEPKVVNDKYFGADNFVAYAPIGETGLRLVLVYPTQEAFKDLYTVIFLNIGVFIIAVILLTVVLAGFFNAKIGRPIDDLKKAAERIATGDLSVQVAVTSKDEIGSLATAINGMTGSLRSIINRVAQSAEQLAASGQQLNASAEQSSEAANQVAGSVTQITHHADKQLGSVNDATIVVERLAASINQVADDSERVAGQSAQAAETAKVGVKSVDQAVGQMAQIEQTVNNSAEVVAKLGERSKEIGQIVEAISGIAGQTNLLALNAAIEAARAGEQGRGFAVVAEEVRKLAEQSQNAAKQITSLIYEIQADTDKAVIAMNNGTHEVKIGRDVVDTAGKAFKEIVGLITEVSGKVKNITDTIRQMENGGKQIVLSMNDIDLLSKDTATEAQTVSAATEEQSASMEEIASASQTLSKMANDLQNLIGKFHF